jgi:ankyrin repeat protein
VQTQSGLAPLHFAVKVDAQQALAVLLSYNANLAAASVHDSPDCITCPPKTTALHVAAAVGNVGTAQQLLKAYVSVFEAVYASRCGKICDSLNC